MNRQQETLNSAIERGREAYEQARGGADRAEPTGGGRGSVTSGWIRDLPRA